MGVVTELGFMVVGGRVRRLLLHLAKIRFIRQSLCAVLSVILYVFCVMLATLL